MKRRAFVQLLSGVAASNTIISKLGAAQLTAPFAAPMRSAAKLDRIGLELYAVRTAMRADPERTLAAIRAMGYTDVELLWSFKNFDRTTAQVRAALDREGLKAPSAHIAPETLLTDWESSLETAKTLGHDYLIVPSLTDDTNRSLDAWRLWADRFNTAGAAARKAGVWLAFHNEPNHMKPIAGQIPYDLFLSRLDPTKVRLQLDVGNMTVGGGDPRMYLAKFPDWYWSFHLKDTTTDKLHDTELGTGIFDMKGFLATVPALASKPCYVEQENATDELASARRNLTYLRQLSW